MEGNDARIHAIWERALEQEARDSAEASAANILVPNPRITQQGSVGLPSILSRSSDVCKRLWWGCYLFPGVGLLRRLLRLPQPKIGIAMWPADTPASQVSLRPVSGGTSPSTYIARGSAQAELAQSQPGSAT